MNRLRALKDVARTAVARLLSRTLRGARRRTGGAPTSPPADTGTTVPDETTLPRLDSRTLFERLKDTCGQNDSWRAIMSIDLNPLLPNIGTDRGGARGTALLDTGTGGMFILVAQSWLDKLDAAVPVMDLPSFCTINIKHGTDAIHATGFLKLSYTLTSDTHPLPHLNISGATFDIPEKHFEAYALVLPRFPDADADFLIPGKIIFNELLQNNWGQKASVEVDNYFQSKEEWKEIFERRAIDQDCPRLKCEIDSLAVDIVIAPFPDFESDPANQALYERRRQSVRRQTTPGQSTTGRNPHSSTETSSEWSAWTLDKDRTTQDPWKYHVYRAKLVDGDWEYDSGSYAKALYPNSQQLLSSLNPEAPPQDNEEQDDVVDRAEDHSDITPQLQALRLTEQGSHGQPASVDSPFTNLRSPASSGRNPFRGLRNSPQTSSASSPSNPWYNPFRRRSNSSRPSHYPQRSATPQVGRSGYNTGNSQSTYERSSHASPHTSRFAGPYINFSNHDPVQGGPLTDPRNIQRAETTNPMSSRANARTNSRRL